MSNDATGGRCCWPGQAWSVEHGRCEGPPACPEGLVAHGDDCVAPHARAESDAPAARGPAVSLGGDPEAARLRELFGERFGERYPQSDAPPVEMRTRRESLIGLYVSGYVVLAIAATYAGIMGTIALSSCCGNNAAWTMYIPLVGGVAWPLADETSYPSGWLGIPATVVETVAISMIIAGYLLERDVSVPHYASAIPRVTGGPGEVGLGLGWQF